jgi:hypothetical protein
MIGASRAVISWEGMIASLSGDEAAGGASEVERSVRWVASPKRGDSIV